ncbi:uncharacterized protein LOC129949579 [Eupeodes corollae]|uniref:uncharacterized protein LOC129949579 n=1 Tax=Eupeodes corollae TaxID=290404 RepID=UPI00248FA07C|nr:uncharacterized protein LOC129949579 [Eupeodes corollae]
MDIPEYNCGVRQEENKNHKLANSYMIAVDSGFESIYNGCTSVLMEKSFSRESFDIFSPNSTNRSPIKQCHSALKYRVSTPKSASTKRHLYSSFYSSSQKRSKSENNENEPMTVVDRSYKPEHINDSACTLKGLHNNGFSPLKNILSSTTNYHQLSFINDSRLSTSKHSTRYEEDERFEQPTVPQRPSKCVRNVAPSGKNVKRKLDIPSVDNKEPGRKLYFNGTRYLNIIGKLEQYPLTLDEIFSRLSSKDLLNVSLVSKNWNSIVKSNRNANARILQYLNESRNFKENLKEPTKPAINLNKRHPFSQFNNISTSKKPEDSSYSSSFFENQNVVQHLCNNERLVKCPRCNRGSIITNSLSRLHSTSCVSVPTSDLTLLNTKSDSICDTKLRENNITKELPQTSENYGICTSVACKFMFCPKCLCDYHPGKGCQISEPESPSKLIICHKKLKIDNKSKLSSKRQSLRRLCFS